MEFIMAIRFVPDNLPQIREMLSDVDMRKMYRHMNDVNHDFYEFFVVWHDPQGGIAHGYTYIGFLAKHFHFDIIMDTTKWFMIRAKQE